MHPGKSIPQINTHSSFISLTLKNSKLGVNFHVQLMNSWLFTSLKKSELIWLMGKVWICVDPTSKNLRRAWTPHWPCSPSQNIFASHSPRGGFRVWSEAPGLRPPGSPLHAAGFSLQFSGTPSRGVLSERIQLDSSLCSVCFSLLSVWSALCCVLVRKYNTRGEWSRPFFDAVSK